ncbi:hypothetical protein HGM15179_010383 [Zosterops borbonicus]|uniref:Uncharacterized protein n=1 Tax=Zosterops borbonicus TaxID=364589 RepID=A0A8K1GF95_9PASS|nr:hypothetical protein HGM15179_010383 [Zosterops borbonicus]
MGSSKRAEPTFETKSAILSYLVPIPELGLSGIWTKADMENAQTTCKSFDCAGRGYYPEELSSPAYHDFKFKFLP